MNLKMAVAEEIEAPFFYLKDTSKTPINRQTNTAKDTNDFRATRDPTVMKIKNGRLLATDPSLDREGFAFLKQVSKVVNFFDDSELNTIYSLEIEDLIRRASGGREVVVFDHTRRSTAPEQ